MRKPSAEVFEKFAGEYRDINKNLGKKQYLIPYFISSHPGCDLNDAVTLAGISKEQGSFLIRSRIFIRLPGPFRPACTIQKKILLPWKKYMWQKV
jgi:radical SAM superfamily enzyme YgiQ (UPF0313 family)